MAEIVKILFVEDSEDDVILMTHYIKQKCVNLEYSWVDTKEKLITQLETDDKWDLIICDNSLPMLSGFEAVKLIKKFCKSIPVICVSGTTIGNHTERCLEAGALAFINKANLEELADTTYDCLLKK